MAQPFQEQETLDKLNLAPEKGWKEGKCVVDEEDLDRDATREHLIPFAYALANMIRMIHMQTFPFARLPGVCPDAPTEAKLEMAVVTDPATGFSVRGRRWHSVAQNKDYLAFDIASEGYESSKGIPFVGPSLVA